MHLCCRNSPRPLRGMLSHCRILQPSPPFLPYHSPILRDFPHRTAQLSYEKPWINSPIHFSALSRRDCAGFGFEGDFERLLYFASLKSELGRKVGLWSSAVFGVALLVFAGRSILKGGKWEPGFLGEAVVGILVVVFWAALKGSRSGV